MYVMSDARAAGSLASRALAPFASILSSVVQHEVTQTVCRYVARLSSQLSLPSIAVGSLHEKKPAPDGEIPSTAPDTSTASIRAESRECISRGGANECCRPVTERHTRAAR